LKSASLDQESSAAAGGEATAIETTEVIVAIATVTAQGHVGHVLAPLPLGTAMRPRKEIPLRRVKTNADTHLAKGGTIALKAKDAAKLAKDVPKLAKDAAKLAKDAAKLAIGEILAKGVAAREILATEEESREIRKRLEKLALKDNNKDVEETVLLHAIITHHPPPNQFPNLIQIIPVPQQITQTLKITPHLRPPPLLLPLPFGTTMLCMECWSFV